MDVSFELYKTFYHVAKNLSFSEAAVEMYISQSAISQAIKTLENKLNCSLFIRNTKRVKLTPEGEILFQHIDQAFNYIKLGERSIESIQSLKQGEIRIGASDTLCKYYLMPFLKKFNKLYPQVKIHITNRPSPRCVELLKKGNVDLSVVNLEEDVHKADAISVQKITEIQDVFVAGDNYGELRSKQLLLQDLVKYPLLMLERNSTTRRFIDAYANKKGVILTPEIELGSMDLLVEMAKIGLGISFVVKEYIQEELEKGEIFQISLSDTLPKRHVGIITNKRIPTPLAAEKFIELLQ